MVVMLKNQALPVFLSSRLLKDVSSFFSTIIYLFPLLRAGVIFTAFSALLHASCKCSGFYFIILWRLFHREMNLDVRW